MENIIVSIHAMEDLNKIQQAGATSVILGSPFFSVRSCHYFTQVQFKQATQMAKQLSLQVYALVNHFFVEEELTRLYEHLVFLKQLEVDGIYFTDLGVYEVAKQVGVEHLLIYNPETIMTNSYDVQAYLDLGIKMITIAKEITLEDMIKIGNKVKGSCEVIIHGPLNMMHSKRELLSNYMTFIDSHQNLNNEMDLYLMEENRDEKMPILQDEQGTHIYTGFHLASFEEMDDLVNANIINFKIECLFYTIDEIVQIIQDYKRVLYDPMKGRQLYQHYQQTRNAITKGFLYKKTGLLK